MGAPLARNHAFSINVCPSCTKPHFSEKCVPLLHETILFCKNTEIRTRGYVNNSRNLPTSRTQRTQGRNIPFEGTPHSDFTGPLKASRASAWSGSPGHRPTRDGCLKSGGASPWSESPSHRATDARVPRSCTMGRRATRKGSHSATARRARGVTQATARRATLRLASDHEAPRVARRMR